MKPLIIEEKLQSIRNEGLIVPVQEKPILRIIDTIYPDNIRAVSVGDWHNIVLDYYASGIKIIVEKFKTVIIDMIKDDSTSMIDIDNGLPGIIALFAERSQNPQTIAIRSLLERFDGCVDWTSNWCTVRISMSNNKTASVVVRESVASVTVYDYSIYDSGETINSITGINTTDIEKIIDTINLYANVPSNELISNNEETLITTKPVSVNLTKPTDNTLNSVKTIINDLISTDNEDYFGTFSDGWKEALSTMLNKISALK